MFLLNQYSLEITQIHLILPSSVTSSWKSPSAQRYASISLWKRRRGTPACRSRCKLSRIQQVRSSLVGNKEQLENLSI